MLYSDHNFHYIYTRYLVGDDDDEVNPEGFFFQWTREPLGECAYKKMKNKLFSGVFTDTEIFGLVFYFEKLGSKQDYTMTETIPPLPLVASCGQ